jgi:hypothetical protein
MQPEATMVVLVSDTSVLIDLERGNLLETAFACGLTMIVPDLLYQRELADHNGPYLRSLGLGVTALSPTELQLAQEVLKVRPGLSLNDCFALSCATRAGHTLVTGDKALRSEAEARTVIVVGLLWLLDRMAEAGVPRQELHDGLSRISGHLRCRLPSSEVKARLKQWSP